MNEAREEAERERAALGKSLSEYVEYLIAKEEEAKMFKQLVELQRVVKEMEYGL